MIDACYDKTATVNSNGTAGGNLYDNANWAGVRARKDLIDKFFPNSNAPAVSGANMPSEAGDDRALFDGVGRTITQSTSADISVFTKGFAVVKFNNFYSTGASAKDLRYADFNIFVIILIILSCESLMEVAPSTCIILIAWVLFQVMVYNQYRCLE